MLSTFSEISDSDEDNTGTHEHSDISDSEDSDKEGSHRQEQGEVSAPGAVKDGSSPEPSSRGDQGALLSVFSSLFWW